ncbi:MAG: hypothetical protein GX639_00065 [Fibrobacter sp.]|nr:hypothetical protein [Fibrobacter sp.]
MDNAPKMMTALIATIESQLRLIEKNNDANQKKAIAETVNLLCCSYKSMTESFSNMYGTFKDFDDDDESFMDFIDDDFNNSDDTFGQHNFEVNNKIKTFRNGKGKKSKKDDDLPF